MKTRFFIFTLTVVLIATSVRADSLRVMTYNSLNFRGAQDAGRVDDFRRVIDYVNPDAVVMVEMVSEAAVDYMLSFAYLPDNDDWAVAPFINGNGTDTDNALFYRTSKVQLVSQSSFDTDPRDVDVFVLRPTSPDTSLRLSIYACHLKAGDTPNDALRRADAAQDIRQHLNQLPEGSLFVLVGDFNLYTSAEDAYQILLADSNVNGQLIDPIDEPGDWNNNPVFAGVHTQSTRVENLGDGGATGGLDDRFDFILASHGLMDTSGTYLVPFTYHPVGNDGQHFNQSINNGTNNAVPDSVADGLYYASDHLPVAVDILLRSQLTSAEPRPVVQSYDLLNCYPNPFNSMLTITATVPLAGSAISIFDVTGRFVTERAVDRGRQTLQLDFSGKATGAYYVRLQSPAATVFRRVTLVR